MDTVIKKTDFTDRVVNFNYIPYMWINHSKYLLILNLLCFYFEHIQVQEY